MALIIMNTETGEMVDELKEGDSILRKSSIESRMQFETAPKGEYFTKLYHAIMPMLIDTSLTGAEIMAFMFLSTHLRPMSNVSKYDNGRLITRENLQSELGVSDRTIKSTVYRLVKEGLIVETLTQEGKVFIVNPYIVSTGDKVNKTVYDLFRKSKWARW